MNKEWSAKDIRKLAEKGLTKQEIANEIGVSLVKLNTVLEAYPRLRDVIMIGREKAREEGLWPNE